MWLAVYLLPEGEQREVLLLLALGALRHRVLHDHLLMVRVRVRDRVRP